MKEQTMDSLLLSLLKQLTRRLLPNMPHIVNDLHASHLEQKSRPSYDEIVKVFHMVAMKYSSIFMIFDALDECQNRCGERPRILREVLNLQIRMRVKLFVTSRFEEVVQTTLKDSIQLRVKATRDDLCAYVAWKLSKFRLFDLSSALRKAIMTTISDAADGM